MGVEDRVPGNSSENTDPSYNYGTADFDIELMRLTTVQPPVSRLTTTILNCYLASSNWRRF